MIFDINAPPANAAQQQAAHAEAQAQADAVNAAERQAAQAAGARSGSTSPVISSVNNDTNNLVALLVQGQQQLIQGQQQRQQIVGAQQAEKPTNAPLPAPNPSPTRSAFLRLGVVMKQRPARRTMTMKPRASALRTTTTPLRAPSNAALDYAHTIADDLDLGAASASKNLPQQEWLRTVAWMPNPNYPADPRPFCPPPLRSALQNIRR